MRKKVSVVIPLYNTEKYIKECLESVLKQTYPVFEIIVVDDGSTDNSAKVVRKFGKKVKLIRQKNKGISGARNTALKHVKGDYISFIDSDDLWLPSKIKKQIDLFSKQPHLGLVDTYVDMVDGQKKLIKKVNHKRGENEFIELFSENLVNLTSSVMITKAVYKKIGGFNEDLPTLEDREYWIRVMEHFETGTVPEYLVKYRIHGKNITSNPDKFRVGHEIMLDLVLTKYKDKLKGRSISKIRSYNIGMYLPMYFKRYDFKKFRSVFYECNRMYPLFLLNHKRYLGHFFLSFLGKKGVETAYRLLRRDLRA